MRPDDSTERRELGPSSRAFFAWALLLALATHASGLYQPMHCDYSVRLRVATDWRYGARLYQDTYCNTQPIVYVWIFAVSGAWPVVGLWIAESVLAALAALAWRQVARNVLPTASWMAPLLWIIASGASSSFENGQSTEAPAVSLLVLSLAAAYHSARGAAAAWSFFSGMAAMLMTGMRIPAAACLLGLTPLALLAWRTTGAYGALSRLASFFAGAALTLFAYYLFGQFDGHWDAWLTVLSRNAQYGAMNRVPFTTSLFEGVRTFARLLLELPAILFMLGLGAGLAWRSKTDARSTQTRFAAYVAIATLLGAVLSAWPGGRHYAHYYHFVWPPLALLAALWLELLPSWLGQSAGFGSPLLHRLACSALLATAIIACGTSGYEGLRRLRDYRAGDHAWNHIQQAQAWLARQAPNNELVVMNLWGDNAELYWKARRRTPTLPIPHIVPSDLHAGMLAAIREFPPPFIIDDGTPWVPIDAPPGAQEPSEFKRWLTTRYEPVERFGAMVALKRKDDPP